MVHIAVKAAKKVPSWVWMCGALGVALYVIKKGGIAPAVQAVTAATVGVVGDAANGAASGVVLGVGDLMNIPRTDETKCQKAQREGNNWDASKYCTAGEYLGWQYKKLEDLFN